MCVHELSTCVRNTVCVCMGIWECNVGICEGEFCACLGRVRHITAERCLGVGGRCTSVCVLVSLWTAECVQGTKHSTRMGHIHVLYMLSQVTLSRDGSKPSAQVANHRLRPA